MYNLIIEEGYTEEQPYTLQGNIFNSSVQACCIAFLLSTDLHVGSRNAYADVIIYTGLQYYLDIVTSLFLLCVIYYMLFALQLFCQMYGARLDIPFIYLSAAAVEGQL